ncbi:MAG: RNA polymerase sigma factor [Holophagales bacterium]|nr:RNA polymerase sigma factor [Holophagales bacterium]
MGTSIQREEFERLYPRLVCWFLKLGASREEAQDFVQEVFLAAWQNIDQFEGRSTIDTWVHSIAKYHWLNHRRRTAHVRVSEVALDDLPPNGKPADGGKALDEQLLDKDLVGRVANDISNLPEEQQSALRMCVRGLAYREIAVEMNVSTSRVSSLIYQARAKLLRRHRSAGSGDTV